MKKILSLAMIVSAAWLSIEAHAATWLTDLPAAQAQAKGEKKPVLINFTGSDWCPACMDLKKNILSAKSFETYAEANLVLVEIDFPRRKAQSAALKNVNAALAQSFQIQYFPTLMLLTSDGAKIGEVQRGESPANFIRHLKTLASAPIPTERGADQPSPAAEPGRAFNGGPRAPPPNYTELKLKGISGSAGHRFALINNQTLAEGETARVRLGSGEVKLRCLEIKEKTAVFTIVGKDARLELDLPDGL